MPKQFKANAGRRDFLRTLGLGATAAALSLLHVRPAGEQAVVPHDQRIVRAKIADDPFAFVEVDRRALIIVIADVIEKTDRGLR